MSSVKKNHPFAPIRTISDAPTTMPFLATIPTIVESGSSSDATKSSFDSHQYETAEERYSDLGQIGKGGMGEIRRVYDQQMHRMVALKVLHLKWSNKPKIIRRFEEEARLTARLQHPGIVPVHEIGELSDGRIYFTMPVIVGETLATVTQKVHSDEQVSPSRLRQLIASFYQASQTIAYVHKEGVLHRDIKPSNIMVGEHGETYVMDWGLAQVITDQELVQEAPKADGGTPSYMAPELIDELNEPHPTSDVYALGATLYKILCGQAPYSGKKATEIMQQVLEAPPKPLSSFLEDGKPIPSGLIGVCEKAMARDPADRFENAQLFCDALVEWRDGDEKRRAALQIIEEAKQKLSEIGLLKQKARALHRQGATMLQRLDKNVSEEKKYSAWKLLDESKALNDKVQMVKIAHVQSLNAAIARAPDLQVGHMALANFYRSELVELEKGNDPVAVNRCKDSLHQHADALSKHHPERSELFRFLRGDGEIDVAIEPVAAEIEMETYNERNRRLHPDFTQHMGRKSTLKTRLGMGSYRFRISAKNAETVLFPVMIDRLQRWTSAVPGQIDHLPLKLLKKGALGEDDAYIPGGWYWSGGPQHETSLPKRRIWVDSFVIRKRPVTNKEYLHFLNELVAQGRETEALRYAPRERSGTFGAIGALIYGRNNDGRFFLTPDADGDLWQPDWPVVMVDWHACFAYTQWLSAKTGLPWRLPYELEREKASRGADGRDMPWGNATAHAWSNIDHQNNKRAILCSVNDFPKDESPYGVMGCAGNVLDWCMDSYSIDGPELFENRFLPMYEESSLRTIMGASWRNRQVALPVWYRDYREQDDRNSETGFRLARSIIPEDILTEDA